MTCIALVIQFLFTIVSWSRHPSSLSVLVSLRKLPWFVYVIALGALPVIVSIHEIVKIHDYHVFIRVQKRSKLEFNTRLGMHSPL
jgi:hypothetical protein